MHNVSRDQHGGHVVREAPCRAFDSSCVETRELEQLRASLEVFVDPFLGDCPEQVPEFAERLAFAVGHFLQCGKDPAGYAFTDRSENRAFLDQKSRVKWFFR